MRRTPLLDPNVPAAHLQSNSGPDRSCLGFGTTVPRRPHCDRDANLQHKPDAVADWTPEYSLAYWRVVFLMYHSLFFYPSRDLLLTHRGVPSKSNVIA